MATFMDTCNLFIHGTNTENMRKHLPLHNQRFPFRNLRPTIDHLNAAATGGRRRLDDPFNVALAVPWPNATQLLQVVRYHISAWHKTKFLFTMSGHHRLQISPNSIFTSNLESARYVIDLLIGSNRFEAGSFHVFTPNAHPVIGFCLFFVCVRK